jgi:hypothetical protein
MNTTKRAIAGFVNLIVILCISIGTYAQTVGSLTFSYTTSAPSGNWGNKHVLAVWIENVQDPSVFIKTNSKYGHEDDHLTSWTSKSGKNLVDAVTGATLSSYGKQSVIWDGTNVSHSVVADGDYKVFIEMGWGKDKVNQHSVMSFTFNKSGNSAHLTPTGNGNYSDVVIDWVPAVTLINSLQNPDAVSVFPNPTKGIINLDFSGNQSSASVIVENSVGASVYRNKIESGFSGLLDIDLSSFANGLYFIKIVNPDKQFVYKVLLNK